MKKDIAVFVTLLLLGVGAVVYPRIQQRIFDTHNQVVIMEFEQRMGAYAMEHRQRVAVENGDYDIPLADDPSFWLSNVRQFLSFMNLRLYHEKQEHLVDPFRYDHPSFNIAPFGLDTDIIGILTIPAIDMNMPIFLGTSFQNLHNGVAHLTHSSFPVGGDSTNAVIAGHRTAYRGRVFSDIEQLVIGDEITISNILESMLYVVVETKIAGPDDIQALAIQSGRDLVTLVTTCTSIRGNRRYIIVAERVG